jgi:hypothetical protein
MDEPGVPRARGAKRLPSHLRRPESTDVVKIFWRRRLARHRSVPLMVLAAGREALAEGPEEVSDQFLEALVPRQLCLPTRRGSESFRHGDVRTPREQVKDLVLGRDAPTRSVPRPSDLVRESSG